MDSCKNCTLRGDLIECQKHPCSVRASWFVEEQQKIIYKLKSGLFEAMDWNWLSDDYPREVADRLFKLASKITNK